MARLVLTVEYADGRPSKSTAPLDEEDVVSGMRDIVFRVAVGEYAAVYVALAKPLDIPRSPTPEGDPA
jgi:hypothetical protein